MPCGPWVLHLKFEPKEDLRQKRRPDIAALRALFAPPLDSLPGVEVQMADLSSYDQLLGNAPVAEEAAA